MKNQLGIVFQMYKTKIRNTIKYFYGIKNLEVDNKKKKSK